MDEPTLVGSDPESSIAVAEQLIRIDIAVREQRLGIDRATNRVRSTLPAMTCLSPAPRMATNTCPSSVLLRSSIRIPGVG